MTGFALIVYDYATNKSWKIQNKLVRIAALMKRPTTIFNFFFQFYPYPNFGTFTIAGESFDLMDGLFGMALSPRKSSDDTNNAVSGFYNRHTERSLYFHSLASGNENFVPLSIINNYTIWEQDVNSQPRAFKTLGSRGIQTAGKVTNRNMRK